MNNSNKYDPFEKMIQEKIDSMESSYNQSWENISKKMDKIDRLKKLKKWGLISILSFGLISLLTIGLLEQSQKTVSPITKTQKSNVQSIIDSSHKIEIENIITLSNKTKDKQIKSENIHSKTENNNYKADHTISESTASIEEEITTTKKDEIVSLPVRNDEFIVESNESIVEKIDSILIISTNSSNFCAGDTLEFSISACNSRKLEWYINNTFHSNNKDGKFVLTGSGSLSFKLIAITEIDTLISNSVDILIEDVSDIQISFQEIEESQVTRHSFSAVSTTVLDGTYFWDFGDDNHSIEEIGNHYYQNNGIYMVSLEYTSKVGCSNKINKSIDVNKKTNLLAPNSFTPNGDGLNDYFMPEGLKISGNPFDLSIFNKRGQMVFNSKNISNAWDGFNQKTGQKCKNDNYIWLVQTTNENGEPEQYKGSIFLFK